MKVLTALHCTTTYLQGQGCLVISIRDPLLDNPGKYWPVLKVGEWSIDARLGIGTWFWPTQCLWVGTILVTSNWSGNCSRGRFILLDIRNRYHASPATTVFCIPPLLFRLFPDPQYVSFLKWEIFLVIAVKVKKSTYIFNFFLSELRITVML